MSISDLIRQLPSFLSHITLTEDRAALAGFRHAGVLWRAAPSLLFLEIPDTARLLISRDHMKVELLRTDAAERLHPLLRRTPLAALIWLSGGWACHGAAVSGPDGAILLLGRSTQGKSSLAAALVARGARLLADDVAPIFLDDMGHAILRPVWPELVLWPDTVKHLLGTAPAWLNEREADWTMAPFFDVAPERFCDAPQPLKAIYCVIQDNLEHPVRLEPVDGMTRLRSGAVLAYQEGIAAALRDPAAHLAGYAAIAGIPFYNAILPGFSLREVAELADRIMTDCGGFHG